MAKSYLDRRIKKLEVDLLRREISRGSAVSYKQLLLERGKRIRERMDAAGDRGEELPSLNSEQIEELIRARLSSRHHWRGEHWA